MMWFLLLLLHTAHIELVVPQAADKLILRNTTNNPCEGYLEVYHKNTWGYVGDAYWSEKTEKVVCKSTHCGEPVANSTVDILKSGEERTTWLNELQCEGSENSLWDCFGPGWNTSVYQGLTMKEVKCSSKITISLDGPKCAGTVQFYDGETSGYFCSDGWGQKGASVVCKSLGCGGVREIPSPDLMESENFKPSKTKMKLNCSAFDNHDPDNLWQCVTGQDYSSSCKPAAVICEGYQRLQLKGSPLNVCSGQVEEEKNGAWVNAAQKNFTFDVCQQMHCGITSNQTNGSLHMTCTDKVNVVLLDTDGRNDTCYGTVNIRVNGSVKPVCGSSWRKEEAELVCKELNCGKPIYFTKEKLKREGVMDHVKCNGSESSLWHCQAQRGKHVQCSSQPKVVCSESVKVKLVDGPGRCSGRLAIELEGQWRRVANTSWTNSQSDTICKQLNCEEHGKTEKFSQGSGNFLSINCGNKQVSDISECLTTNQNRQPPALEAEAVGITCDDYKMIFLGGPEACSGHVGIKHGKETYWLSGSNATWNNESANTVCQQMHCKSAISFSSEGAENRNVWNESYNCLSSKESLFDCNKTTSLPPDHHNSTAYVKCSGKIEMNLTEGCWGNVKVYTQGARGGVCADTWTETMSEKLCTYLSCGKALKTHQTPRGGDIKFNSLHATDETANLTQWNFVKTQDSDKSCNQRPAYVVCAGSVKPRFSTSSEKCSGNIEMKYEGQWIPVCSDALADNKAQNIICQALQCGDAVKRLPYFGPAPAGKQTISSLKCSADSLSKCTIDTSQCAYPYGGLQCAVLSVLDRKAMVLAGKGSCSGTVLVHWRNELRAVSRRDWTETEKNRLCQDMNCGKHSTDKTQDKGIKINSFWNKSFRCPNDRSKNIWECEQETPPAENNTLFIKCQGKPSVTLSKGCNGKLSIDGIPVCARNWDLSYARKVCQETNCGNAISVSNSTRTSSDTYHVSCDNYHSLISQCRRIRGKCDDSLVNVSCSASVKFRTTGKIRGELEVNYGNEWEKVCVNPPRTEEMNERICAEINKTETHSDSNTNTQGNLQTLLECAEGVKDIKRCVKPHSCEKRSTAAIGCNHVGPTTRPTPNPSEPPSLASIIVGVILLLLVLILIVFFIRFFVRRARKSRVSSRMLSTKDMEYESGEYEDVMDKENEMEDFSPGRLRSEDEFITENDGHSVSSLPYDDIDEADEARPLTSPGAAAPADQDVNMHEGGVTYEVEDPQESYDDIDAIHETTQTKAEVHDSPQNTDDTAAPPALAQRDEDYLEPDQDG